MLGPVMRLEKDDDHPFFDRFCLSGADANANDSHYGGMKRASDTNAYDQEVRHAFKRK